MIAIPTFSALARHLSAQQSPSNASGGTFRISGAVLPDPQTAWAFLDTTLQVVTVEYSDGHLEVLLSENVAETRLGIGLAAGRVFA